MGGERVDARGGSSRGGQREQTGGEGEVALNYDHGFHAGNFADVMKHAILLQLIGRLTDKGQAPLTVLDTHAGAGTYDLDSEAARRSGEADGGVRRLISTPDLPPALGPLMAAVRAMNPPDRLQLYPGSPAVIVGALRPGDRYAGCELGQSAHAELARSIQPMAEARGVKASLKSGDGYAEVTPTPPSRAPRLVFVDPPFEQADDYARIIKAAARLRGQGGACAAVWTPLKDLETFDALLRGLEALGLREATVAQVRLRPLTDPMRMNGCAMILIDTPDVSEPASAICDWVATTCGEPGGRGRVFRL